MSERPRLNLFIDSGGKSKKAIKMLDEANLHYGCFNIEGRCDSDWVFPTLFSPEGEFETLDDIRTYLNSNYAKNYRKGNG